VAEKRGVAQKQVGMEIGSKDPRKIACTRGKLAKEKKKQESGFKRKMQKHMWGWEQKKRQ